MQHPTFKLNFLPFLSYPPTGTWKGRNLSSDFTITNSSHIYEDPEANVSLLLRWQLCLSRGNTEEGVEGGGGERRRIKQNTWSRKPSSIVAF